MCVFLFVVLALRVLSFHMVGCDYVIEVFFCSIYNRGIALHPNDVIRFINLISGMLLFQNFQELNKFEDHCSPKYGDVL